VERTLDEADRMAEETSMRYSHEEVFDKLRKRIN
jgi:hypothetical protein